MTQELFDIRDEELKLRGVNGLVQSHRYPTAGGLKPRSILFQNL